MAPTLAYLLGAPYPSSSRGQVLTDAFDRSFSKDKEKAV
jgi:hypothetical protein